MSNLIETYEVAGRVDGALTLTRRYLELFPNAEDALDKKIKIGILYDHLGYYDQAVLHLQSFSMKREAILKGSSGTTLRKPISIREITSRQYSTS